MPEIPKDKVTGRIFQTAVSTDDSKGKPNPKIITEKDGYDEYYSDERDELPDDEVVEW